MPTTSATLRTRHKSAGREPAFFQIRHAHDHRPPRIIWQVLKPMPDIERAHGVIDRMSNDAPASHISRGPERCTKRKQQQRARIPPSLVVPMYRKLTKERSRQWIRFVAPIRFLQGCPLDLSSAQRDIANDQACRLPTQDIDPRQATSMVRPAMAPEPLIHRSSAAIERHSIVIFGKRPRWNYFCHLGAVRDSLASASMLWAGP